MKNPCAKNLSQQKKQRGAVLAYTVLSVLFLFLAVGLGVDLSHLYLVKTELQNAADAAALAGATALRLDEGQRLEAAMDRAVAVLNENKYNFNNKEFDDEMSEVDQRNLVEFAVNLDGPYHPAEDIADDRNIRFVKVTTPDVPVSIFFAAAILTPNRNMSVSATAGLAVVSSKCVVSLKSNNEKTLYVHSDSTLTASQCDIQVNSTNSQALYVSSGFSHVTAGDISVAGSGWHQSGNSNPIVSPNPDVNEPVLADPLAHLNVPVNVGPCTYNSLVEIQSDSPSKTLDPGVYCGGIKIGSNVPLATFNPGLYIINGYGLEISSGTNVQGDGVTFINTAGHNGVSADKYEPIKIVSNSNADLSAPTAGEGGNPGNVPSQYLDVLFHQDPTCGSKCADTSLKNIVQINNTDGGPGAELKLKGALHFPNQILAVESQSNLIVDGQVIANEIKVESNSHLNVRMGDAGSLTLVPIVLYK